MDTGIKIDISRLKEMLSADPTKKRKIREKLDMNYVTLSNLLSGKRQMYAGELLVIADVLGVNAADLAA